MGIKVQVCLTFLLALIWIQSCRCHPQCLDFKPPFSSDRQQAFCPQYRDFGCCTYAEDSQLAYSFSHLAAELLSRNLWHCGQYMRDLLCQACSPYAAHIYDYEGGSGRVFPGLCENHCRMLYRQCQEALYLFILRITGSAELVHSLNAEDTFCTKVSLVDQDYCFPELLTNPILNDNITMETVNSEGCLCVELFADELRNPIFMKYPEDGSGRSFVGEQKGMIYVFHEDGTRLPEPFLDIRNVTMLARTRFDERGLLGMALHPQYHRNGRFFIYYVTDQLSEEAIESEMRMALRISEFTVLPWDPNKADRNSERVLVELPKYWDNHNGGELLFGDDGYLYIFIGDGGSAGDPDNNSQNMAVFFGKVLRIDVNSPPGTGGVGSPDLPYAIPPDNPFLGLPGVRPEIYAYGVRNIWRCGKDHGDPITGHGRGRIICGDVGQSAFEEIHEIKKGANFGWRGREGFECYDDEMCGNIGPEELPIFAYPHRVGKSVTGGHFYRGCENPNLNGYYFYADFWVGKLFRLAENETGQWESRQIDMCGPQYCNNALFAHTNQYIISFAEDLAGEVYILSSRTSKSYARDGGIFKIVDPRRRNNPLMCHNLRRQAYGYAHRGRPASLTLDTAEADTKGPGDKTNDSSGRIATRHVRNLFGAGFIIWLTMVSVQL